MPLPVAKHAFLTFSAAVLLCVVPWASASPSSPANEQRNAQRETRKLEPLPKEELSAQSLVDIYVACIKLTLVEEEGRRTKRINEGSLHQHCREERSNLAEKISLEGVRKLDGIFLSAYNDAAAKVVVEETD